MHVRHHDVRRKPISNHGDLTGFRDSGDRPGKEVLHDLRSTTGFLGRMPEDLYSRSIRQQVCFPTIGVTPSTSRIADYQEMRARVSFTQSLEFILSTGLV